MSSRFELIIFRCHANDVAVLRGASGPRGPVFVDLSSRAEVVHRVATRRPAGIFLGVGTATLDHLEVIPMIRTVGGDLPVIVVGEEDSLDLERRARQHTVFYYLVHPIDRQEVEDVLNNVLRRARA
jgi:DNA-binding NtrC family response regulator